jgi:hypothetical protein
MYAQKEIRVSTLAGFAEAAGKAKPAAVMFLLSPSWKGLELLAGFEQNGEIFCYHDAEVSSARDVNLGVYAQVLNSLRPVREAIGPDAILGYGQLVIGWDERTGPKRIHNVWLPLEGFPDLDKYRNQQFAQAERAVAQQQFGSVFDTLGPTARATYGYFKTPQNALPVVLLDVAARDGPHYTITEDGPKVGSLLSDKDMKTIRSLGCSENIPKEIFGKFAYNAVTYLPLGMHPPMEEPKPRFLLSKTE